jgi:hypothetical protein
MLLPAPGMGGHKRHGQWGVRRRGVRWHVCFMGVRWRGGLVREGRGPAAWT